MQITVSSRNIEVSDALRAAATQKIERVGRLLPDAHRAEVHFCEERNPRIANREVCEVTLVSGRHHLQCRASAPDGFAAVDLAVSKLSHQVHRVKDRTTSTRSGTPRR